MGGALGSVGGWCEVRADGEGAGGEWVGGRLYGPWLKAQGLRAVGQIARVVDVPVIGRGGIHPAADPSHRLEAGAAAVPASFRLAGILADETGLDVQAAQHYGVAMGLGSQRAGIQHPEVADTFKVRSVAPDILLFANLGAVQFNYGYDVEHCIEAVQMIEADALILHLNPLQEAVQPEGDVNWRGLLGRIEEVCRTLGRLVIS